MKILKVYILFLLLLLMPFCGASGKVWKAKDVPIPYLTDSTQYVSDPDGYLAAEERDSANFYLRRLNLECGVQNVLVIVGRVYGQDAFRMAQDIGNDYGVGHKKSRRGLVVVIAVEDRKAFIAPGMGLEGELTDVDCNDIARACIAVHMREGKPGEAVVAASRALYNKVKSGRTGISRVDGEETDDDVSPLLLIGILLLCFGMPLWMIVRRILQALGIIKKNPSSITRSRRRRRDNDDFIPPFFFGGGGGFSGGSSGSSGGSFGGGSFGGGGSGTDW